MTLSPEAVLKKLIRVFKETFPDVDRDDWPNATRDNTSGWDSFATLTILTTVEQALNIRVGLDRVQYIHSFEDVYLYVLTKCAII
jgi:acyl carrier protein